MLFELLWPQYEVEPREREVFRLRYLYLKLLTLVSSHGWSQLTPAGYNSHSTPPGYTETRAMCRILLFSHLERTPWNEWACITMEEGGEKTMLM